jgi:hypothetical protein
VWRVRPRRQADVSEPVRVESVTASPAQDSVSMICDPGKVTPAVIGNAIQTLGSTARP